MNDQEKERAQVEMVFCLGGGELDDEGAHGFRYTYEGIPHYMEAPDDRWSAGVHYWTAIACELFGEVEPPPGCEIVARFRSSGEAECWCEDGCECCEGWSTVYIGDGWTEIVFREVTPEIEAFDVCEDCYLVICTGDESSLDHHYSGDRLDDWTPEKVSRAIWEGWESIVDGRDGHESPGDEGEHTESSNDLYCECCDRRVGAGKRYRLNFVPMPGKLSEGEP